jgi:hypothetical protein
MLGLTAWTPTACARPETSPPLSPPHAPPGRRLHTSGLALGADVDIAAIAAACHGYSGADLASLAREAAMHAFSTAAAAYLPQDGSAGSGGGETRHGGSRPPQQPGVEGGEEGGGADPWGMGIVGAADFQAAARRVGPSIVRGAAVEPEPVRWVADRGAQRSPAPLSPLHPYTPTQPFPNTCAPPPAAGTTSVV